MHDGAATRTDVPGRQRQRARAEGSRRSPDPPAAHTPSIQSRRTNSSNHQPHDTGAPEHATFHRLFHHRLFHIRLMCSDNLCRMRTHRRSM